MLQRISGYVINTTVTQKPINSIGERATVDNPQKCISNKLAGHAVWFRAFNDVTYRGNLAQVKNKVAKIVYMLGTAIPHDRAESGVATAYLDKSDWNRLSFE